MNSTKVLEKRYKVWFWDSIFEKHSYCCLSLEVAESIAFTLRNHEWRETRIEDTKESE